MDHSEQTIIGRYALFDEIASGGMATVHMGRLLGAAGFSRMVAIKRLHKQFAKDPAFVSMFVDEARLAARIRHPNVVPTLDVVRTDDELFLVMEYVPGESLSRLLERARRRKERTPPEIAVGIVAGVLHGLHAAHTARGERGEPLEIVHRDVSPQNVMVGSDGIPRVLDFGIAKASVRLQTTRDGQIKGKLAYMAPEQLAGGKVGPATDVYAASLVLWEALAGKRLFQAEHEAALLAMVIGGADEPPSKYEPTVPGELDELVMQGLRARPDDRFATAREMAQALEKAFPPAPAEEIGVWVESLANDVLSTRAERISIIESESDIQSIADILSGSDDRPSSSGAHAAASGGSTADSQLSSISVARSQSTRHPARQTRVRLVGLAALALLAGGAAALLFFGDDRPPAETDDQHAEAASPAQTTSESEPSARTDTSSAQPSAAPTDETTSPSATATTDASAAPTTVPTTPRPIRPRATVTKSPKPPTRSDCNPPYTIDSEGIRHIKPQCVR